MGTGGLDRRLAKARCGRQNRAQSCRRAAIETGRAEGFLAAHAVTTIHYLISRQLQEPDVKRALGTLLKLFTVAAVDGSVLQRALQSSGADFEDSVTAAAAQASGCHLIVTRDPKGFRRATLPALTPAQALALLR